MGFDYEEFRLQFEFAEDTLCGIFSVLMQGIRHGEEMQSLILLSC